MAEKYCRVKQPNKRRLKPLTEERLSQALRASGGIQSHAARLVSRTPARVSQMIRESDYLKEVRDAETQEIFDLAKKGLKHLVKRKNVIACIYCCKTLGKNEGWSERHEVVSANVNVGDRGVLLLPAPANSLGDWETLASQWDRKQLPAPDNDVVDYYGDDE
ncbi:MAG: hypothetical protein IMF10_06665 [Proteobacteria bacterium]|nr:hypothetical protein [Pseudomonadota bacterium]